MDKYRWQANFYFVLWLFCIITSLIQSWTGYTASEKMNQNVTEMHERFEKQQQLIDARLDKNQNDLKMLKEILEVEHNLFKKDQF